MLLPNLDHVSESYLQSLCDDKCPESQTLEFTLELPSTEKNQELMKDVCALANADGGDLVYGIAEVSGAASKVVPLTSASLDTAKRRIIQVLDNIEPRVQGLRVHPIEVSGGYIVIARVPASFDGPHSYRVESSRRFVMRNGTSTTDMSFDQIRTAFDRTATLADRAHQFIDKRFNAISRGHTWKPFVTGPICVVALVPIAGLAGRISVDIAALNTSYEEYMFEDWTHVSKTMNLDGLVVYPNSSADGALAYSQVYRNGAVEGLRTGAVPGSTPPRIPSTVITKFYRDAVDKFVRASRHRGFTGPAVLRCALLSTNGYALAVGQSNDPVGKNVAATDRNDLVLPDVWINAIEGIEKSEQVDAIVRPMMDVLWQAFDVKRCLEFDMAGNWAPRT